MLSLPLENVSDDTLKPGNDESFPPKTFALSTSLYPSGIANSIP